MPSTSQTLSPPYMGISCCNISGTSYVSDSASNLHFLFSVLGQRKRVNIGMEMVANPIVLFLDGERLAG